MEAAGCYLRTALSLYVIIVVRAGEMTLPDVQCTSLNEGHPVDKTQNHCFCYKPNWHMDMVWSTLQIHVQSKESVFFLPHHNCTQPEDVYDYIYCWLDGVTRPRDFEDVLIDISRLDKDFCFHIKFSKKSSTYSVTVLKIWFHLRIFAVLAGILLFCLADKLSRSSLFFYATGIMLGMTASVLFLLIALKRFISKPNTFWLLLSTCCFLTAYVVQFLTENITWIWTEKKPFVIGYFVTLGLLSFAACYSHGQLHSEFSFNLFSWMLQIIACLLIFFGHPVYEIAFSIIAVLLSCKGIPYLHRAISYIYRKVRYKKSVIRYLTEEEYNEQCEVETLKALKELHDFCNSPDVNSWLMVSRLSSPKRERLIPECVKKSVKGGGGSVMVWGMFPAAGVGPLIQLHGYME
ncbi:nuclear envelope integral membrane protein 2 isoform X2 [Hyla sarda]|uniref:nuclear envelope integral membrane protein 2 isoform X2 n=1 Tax=Hyla sarda TaxID=327740 RepID=UPI0024C26E08|nr:nuclear envelope integral membrane protein 2 isoform X2 [Hyla sarda]